MSKAHLPAVVAAICSLTVLAKGTIPPARSTETLAIRGHAQVLRLYGRRDGNPVVVSSGDGGWIHLGPHVAELLAARGYFVVGFDARAYLEGFTDGRRALQIADEPGDYRVLADFARGAAGKPPILVGVSEGGGLSLLAATDPGTRSVIAGVIGIGLPDTTELGWRWSDMVTYVTHGVPHEPTFSAAAIAVRVAPAPLAAIHSTRDEFVPVADVEKVMRAAGDPKRLWIVNASNHRFSDNLQEFDARLLEAIDWVRRNAPQRETP